MKQEKCAEQLNRATQITQTVPGHSAPASDELTEEQLEAVAGGRHWYTGLINAGHVDTGTAIAGGVRG